MSAIPEPQFQQPFDDQDGTQYTGIQHAGMRHAGTISTPLESPAPEPPEQSWRTTSWTGTDAPRADAEKAADSQQFSMAWFYTMFALFCWVFAIMGAVMELDQHGSIVPALLFGIPAIITTVIAVRLFHQYYEMHHDANPYAGLLGVDGKDIASELGVKSLQMQHYDSDGDPDPYHIDRILFPPMTAATLRFPTSISPHLWRQNRPPVLVRDDINDQLDSLAASETTVSIHRIITDSLNDCERLNIAYITLRIANGRASITDIESLSTAGQQMEFKNKGAIACISGGRYDDDAKALIVGVPNARFKLRPSAL